MIDGEGEEGEADRAERVFSFYPMKLGDRVFVGEGAVVEAAMVGRNFVHIGAGAVIVLSNLVPLPPGTRAQNFVHRARLRSSKTAYGSRTER